MNTFERPLVDDLVRLLTDELPPRIVAVTGPRQSGKTTLVRQALRRLRTSGLPGRHIGVDDPQAGLGAPFSGPETTTVPIDPALRNAEWLVGVWDWARDRAWRRERGFVLALDEIQYVEGWSGVVKGLWDRDRETGCPLKVIILGSAPWSLLTGRGESLAGRFMPLDVRHWPLQEMVICLRFNAQRVSVLRRLSRGRAVDPGHEDVARLRGEFHHRAGLRARHPGADAGGQARPDAPTRGPGPGVLGADRHVHQPGGAAPGCRERNDGRPLPRSPVRRRHRGPPAQLLGERRPEDPLQPQAQRAQQPD